ncbi:expressed unknown protein [Seminavis robusta]|uniref:Uncharacterized protein n=1 Tax=Seminavis robusta TaxID=568900 RepID=A0A9N8HM75_9STRA|nr:expressed unknown protein [Seminavis robusta]|eukprot:Sro975_g226760.1 n/a (333) ;mRNA; f:11428-12426
MGILPLVHVPVLLVTTQLLLLQAAGFLIDHPLSGTAHSRSHERSYRYSIPAVSLAAASSREEETAEKAEDILREKLMNDATEVGLQDFQEVLDAWMMAFHKSTEKDNETRAFDYGHRMESILTLLEASANNNSIIISIEPYSLVMQVYLQRDADPMAALRVLSRMENMLYTAHPSSEFLNNKQRLIQYNRVLQGLASKMELCSLIAVPLLLALAQEQPVILPKDDQVEPFVPRKLQPDTASFAVVLEPLLEKNYKLNAFQKPIGWLVRQANLSGILFDNEEDTQSPLLQRMEKAVAGDKDHLDRILVEALTQSKTTSMSLESLLEESDESFQ